MELFYVIYDQIIHIYNISVYEIYIIDQYIYEIMVSFSDQQ